MSAVDSSWSTVSQGSRQYVLVPSKDAYLLLATSHIAEIHRLDAWDLGNAFQE